MNKLNAKCHILYESNYMQCPEQVASMMIRDDQWLPRAGEMGAVGGVCDCKCTVLLLG